MITKIATGKAPRSLTNKEVDYARGGSYGPLPSESQFVASSGPDWLTIINWCNAQGCGYYIP